jgi:hypothetical protein
VRLSLVVVVPLAIGLAVRARNAERYGVLMLIFAAATARRLGALNRVR